MNTVDFFNDYLAARLLPASQMTDDPVSNINRALGMSHFKPGGKTSRFTGWAVVTPKMTWIQPKLVHQSEGLITGVDQTRYEMFLSILQRNALPAAMLVFEKKITTIDMLFVTYDTRAVRICGPKVTETFNVNDSNATCMTHRVLRKRMGK